MARKLWWNLAILISVQGFVSCFYFFSHPEQWVVESTEREPAYAGRGWQAPQDHTPGDGVRDRMSVPTCFLLACNVGIKHAHTPL